MLIFTFEADRFLLRMVRLIVGTAARIGEGKLAPEAMEEILASEDNARSRPQAPPTACSWSA